jgi:hypothetical protein
LLRAKGSGRAQILDSIADGLCRRREAPILFAATLRRLCQKQFSRAECQSSATPSLALYWHIGETAMRLASWRSASFIGENRALVMADHML